MEFLKKYTSHQEYEVDKTPNVSLCVENNEKHLHYTKKNFDDEYLTFEALESGTFTLTIGSAVTTGDVVSVSYSLDNGKTWTTTNNVQEQQVVITTPTVNAGDEVLWKGNAVRMANSFYSDKLSTFSSTANFNARGNVMSLLYGDEFKDEVSLSGKDYCFYHLFYDNLKLINGKNISLPATTLVEYCYAKMFYGCTNLTTAPELPATTLVNFCYQEMFCDCTSLTTAPVLSATTLADYCYSMMFRGCTSLTVAPELPATTLASYCYRNMFEGCTSLTTAPELPATTLANECYASMFYGCTSLTTAPELPATTLVNNCYWYMFYGCTSLTVAPKLPATTLAQYCYYYMFNGCISLTTAPELPATTLASYCYNNMFRGCTNLTTAPVLPAITLTERCYRYMFRDCTNLTVAPELPATRLANQCYQSMFNSCTNLTVAPELPATELASQCYSYMFQGCTNLTVAPELTATELASSCYECMFQSCTGLTTAPELPATALATHCYENMFGGCTSLTTAPELPAATLTEGCYQNMFRGCTSLTAAPELPATTLASSCYRYMFFGCASLSSITCPATDISASNCTTNWVNGVASSGTFTKTDGMNDWTRGYNGIPTNWTVAGYYESKPFTLKTDSGNDGVFTINKPSRKSIDYSTDNGLTWTTTSARAESITASTILIKSTDINNNWSSEQGSDGISCSVKFHVEGNIMSLLYGDDFTDKYVVPNYAFADFLRVSSNLTSAKNLILPATTLGDYCYCEMFEGCTSLTTVPALPATTLANGCYLNMLSYCTSLTTAPVLSATTLANSCYQSMFYGCTSLTTVPALPATTLANSCYQYMFEDCTSLTTAPELPATTLAQSCYSAMFYGCTSLNSITCLATNISASNCTQYWVSDVAVSGTFTKAPSMNSWTTGVNGIPTNWTVRDYSTISISLVMYVDDFPEDKMDGESKETVMTRQLNSSDECLIGNKYVYTGETITYNGNTYYLWEMSDDCTWDSQVAYLLTATDNFNTLYAQSLEDDLTNHFTSLVGRLDDDKEDMYNDGEIGDEYELYLVKVIDNNPALLRIWVDDFPEDEDYDEGSAQDEMIAEVEDPEGKGANPYEYLGETIVYNGNTYYLWQAVEGYNVDNPMTKYFATTTIDFNTLYSQSLEDDLTNHFTDAIGMFNDSKNMYWAQEIDENDELYLVKVEDLS